MHVLLVDQNAAAREACRHALNHSVVEQRRSRIEALTYLRSRPTPLVLLGSLGNGQFESIAFIRELRQEFPQMDTILLAHESSESAAVAALRAGAWDYLPAGIDPQSIRDSVERWMQSHTPPATNLPSQFDRMVGSGNWTAQLRMQIEQLSRSNCNVLITGETGTGKEVVAELIHSLGSRGRKPFVCINCAAVPDALFESELFGSERGAFTGAVATREGKLRQAQGGTVFLDEIGEMTTSSQAKILRAIESRSIQRLGGSANLPIDIRIVAATNQSLEELCERNLFRRDLFYRLSVARLELIPLRRRPEDIPELVDHFVRQFSAGCSHAMHGFSPEAIRALQCYSWPGNIRELRNIVEVAFVTCNEKYSGISHLPASLLRESGKYVKPCSSDRDTLIEALRVVNWNKSAAAQQLKWSRMTLYRKMAQYGIAEDGRMPAARVSAPGPSRRKLFSSPA